MIKIRKGKLSDVKILVSLDKKAHKEIKWWRAMNQKEFIKLVKAKNHIYIAEQDNKIVGYLSADIKDKKLFLENVYVKRDFRKKHISNLLIKKFISDWRYSKYKTIELFSPERLRKFYEKLGFKLSALFMKKELK